jgi:hypothetical protein
MNQNDNSSSLLLTKFTGSNRNNIEFTSMYNNNNNNTTLNDAFNNNNNNGHAMTVTTAPVVDYYNCKSM